MEICRFDGRTGWCVACGRTLGECREWRKASHPRLLAIGVQLPSRMANHAARGVVAERPA